MSLTLVFLVPTTALKQMEVAYSIVLLPDCQVLLSHWRSMQVHFGRSILFDMEKMQVREVGP